MGIWHNHGAVDFGIFSERGYDSNVTVVCEENQPALPIADIGFKLQIFAGTVDKAEHLFYTK